MIRRMLSVEEAQRRVMAEIEDRGTEEIAFADALGRVLREDVVATHDLPGADNSAMDGYAVRAEDIESVPVTLPVIGDIPAGHPASRALEPRTAMRIMTGAFVPEGADTVVQVELTDELKPGHTWKSSLTPPALPLRTISRCDPALTPAHITILQSLPRGANIRRRGEDMRAGEVIVRAGVRIGAAETAMLVAAGRTRVRVGRRPTVAILSTGDELVEAGETPRPGQIVNTNAHLLAALVRESGAIPRVLGIVRDTREATIAAFEEAIESDFVISSGGVSVGAYDFVKDALESLGAETKFWRVSMKPGKPIVLSRLGDRVLFGLPGNPASCFVSFHLFVAPALRKSMGQGIHSPVIRMPVTAPLRSAGDRRLYARVNVSVRDGALLATPLASQGSGSLTSMVDANGLAIVAEGVTRVDAGTEVPVLMIGRIAS